MVARIRIQAVPLFLGCAIALGCGGEDMEPRDRADHCPVREELSCAVDVGGTFPLSMTGMTTSTGPDGFGDVSCASGGGAGTPDAAFRWTAPWAGRFRISTEGSAFDTALSIREGSCGREIMCNDDIARGNTQSALVVDVDDCETLTIVVDGYGGSDFGNYELNITGVETACGDGSDDDLDGAVDCDDDDCGFTIECIDDDPGEWPMDLTEQEFRVLELTNEARARGANCGGEDFPPVGPLEAEPRLRTAARLHSQDMAINDYFDHVSQDGRMLNDRITATGHPGGFVGENIAFGQSNAAEVVQGWLDSPGHCRNMMNGGYRYLGVGAARNPGGRIYWTQNFSGGR